MSDLCIGYCGLSRNWDRLPAHAHVVRSGSIDAAFARAQQRAAPPIPQTAMETESARVEALLRALSRAPEAATTIAERAGLPVSYVAAQLWRLARRDGFVAGALGPNPLYGQSGQRRHCWLYWRMES